MNDKKVTTTNPISQLKQLKGKRGAENSLEFQTALQNCKNENLLTADIN